MVDTGLTLWVAGVSVSGFLFLAGWCWNLHEKYSSVIKLVTSVSSTAQKVDEIHTALVGDMKREGLISKQRRMEEQCKLRHGEA